MNIWVLASNNWDAPIILGVYSDREAVDAAIARIEAGGGTVVDGIDDPLGRYHEAVHVSDGELDKPETW